MSVREIAERLGPVREVQRHTFGSQEVVSLRPSGARKQMNTITAALALTQCGISLLRAKQTIERVIDEGEERLLLPLVSTRQELSQSLAAAGVSVTFGADVGSCQR